MKRRDFIKYSGAVAGSAALRNLAFKSTADAEEQKKIVRYRELGKTGLKMSDISYGTGKLNSASLIARAVSLGINYFDTAPDYGRAENFIGEYLAAQGGRDKLIIASKLCTYIPYPGHLPLGTSKEKYIESVEGSLKRMNTDYIDICFVHAIGEEKSKDYEQEKARLFDPNMLTATDELKKQGKIRFRAVSSHGPNNIDKLLMDAVKSGHFDVIMPTFNFFEFPGVREVIQEAKSRGIGVVAMKTLAGGKDLGIKKEGESFEHAAFAWALSRPGVSGLVITMKNFQQINDYVGASGKEFSSGHKALLDLYKERFSTVYCRTGCGDCLGSCPRGIDIPAVLRYKMYFEDYHDEKEAMRSYSAMSPKADGCAACPDAVCDAACPHGVLVSRLMKAAHEQLVF
ncbi:MAG: aldo/keto reductase [Nitrospinae bacterium]|nr:aldo/keto reductase [Nitrospinota bacterium]